MSRASRVVERLRTTPKPVQYIHTQSIKIPEEVHCKLIALAEYARASKSGLASELLMDAIDEAMEALPLDPPDVKYFGGGEPPPETVRDMVYMHARHLYADFLHDRAGDIPPDDE